MFVLAEEAEVETNQVLVQVQSASGQQLDAAELERDTKDLYDRLRAVLPDVELGRTEIPPETKGLQEIDWTAVLVFLSEPVLGVFLGEAWDWLKGKQSGRRLRLVMDGMELELSHATDDEVGQVLDLVRRRLARRLRG
jgi:hypothetical protein